jgi:hypothetical protein
VKALLDEDLPHELRLHIPNDNLITVAYLGWDGLRNGELLRAAEEDGFEVFVTGDKNFCYRQNLSVRKMGIVVLPAQDWPVIRDRFSEIAIAVDRTVPGSFQFVEFDKSRKC